MDGPYGSLLTYPFFTSYFQPEIVPPSALKKKKKHRRRTSSSGGSPNSKTVSKKPGFDSSTSSTTEMGGGTGNDTDVASDVEELPADEPCSTSLNMSKLKTSQSSIDFGHPEPEPMILERSNSVKTHSQPDLLQLEGEIIFQSFYHFSSTHLDNYFRLQVCTSSLSVR